MIITLITVALPLGAASIVLSFIGYAWAEKQIANMQDPED